MSAAAHRRTCSEPPGLYCFLHLARTGRLAVPRGSQELLTEGERWSLCRKGTKLLLTHRLLLNNWQELSLTTCIKGATEGGKRDVDEKISL
jgi:hypothetical protein